PMVTLSGDGDVLDSALDDTAVPELYPADLGQVDGAPIDLEALRIAETVGQELLAVDRWRCPSSEEIGVGPLQIDETLLQTLGVGILEPSVFLTLFPPGDQRPSSVVVQTRCTSKIATFIDRQNLVPDKTAGTSIFDELLPDMFVRFQAVLIATTKYHSKSIVL